MIHAVALLAGAAIGAAAIQRLRAQAKPKGYAIIENAAPLAGEYLLPQTRNLPPVWNDARKLGDIYANGRIMIIEGVAQ